VRVKFWGTRGSIARPGPDTARYGGNTSCVEVRSERGTLIILDCGTGAHPLGQKLISDGGKLRGHILISHTHWDHIQGIPFFAPLFVSGNEWDIYGPRGLAQSLRDALAGQMQYSYFPVAIEQCGATIRYHDLVEGTFNAGDVKITTQYLNHPGITLGYRLEADGATVVYSCDHEAHSRILATGQGDITGQDLRHARFMDGAGLLIHDAQYAAADFPAKFGWGHSSAEYAVKLAQYAGVKRLALTHHDPLRDDNAMDGVLKCIREKLRANASPLDVFAAVEGQIVEVEPSPPTFSDLPRVKFAAMTHVEPALVERSILLGISDPIMAASLSEVIRAENIRTNFCSTVDEMWKFIVDDRPSLAILEHDLPSIDGLSACAKIRQMERDNTNRLPVIILASQEDRVAGAAVGVTDWLIKPFSNSYSRTKVVAWVLRSACRWMRAAIPEDEERRIASLRELRILDTEPEERFDRLTRLAAALFNVPIALVSLVDESRQWFKSCLGLNVKETSRDASFCAHVIFSREPMIVADTIQDERFADNPLVVGGPRIRFYAGYPLILHDGSCIGTLCLLDTRPHASEEIDLASLRDLTDLVMQELGAAAAPRA
jgi:phosphoribosyl 1,2-cyclic phosphodiesterase/CheY-like chemotaxis protein